MILLKALLALMTLIVLGRMIFLLLASEIGRKFDLVKRRYRNHPEFNFAILIPIINKDQWQAFAVLLAALTQQSYPLELIQIHLLVPEPLKEKLQTSLQSPLNVTFWGFPKIFGREKRVGIELINWGVERLLALGGTPKQIVTLTAEDIIKPDFIEQLAYKAALYPAVQSYMALKRKPTTWLAMLNALNQRLFNRIEQAGRTHLGFSAKLQTTGWMIHQDVLEKVPLFWALGTYPEGYQLLLNRAGYNVHWATGVMVYQNETLDWKVVLAGYKQKILSRIHFIVEGSQALLSPKLLFQKPLAWVDHLWQLIKPPDLMIGVTLFLLLIIAIGFDLSISSFLQFVFFAYLALSLISLVVARFSGLDILFYTFAAPLGTVAILLALPAYIVFSVLKQLFEPISGPENKKENYKVKTASVQPLEPTQNHSDQLINELMQNQFSETDNGLKESPLPNHLKQPHELVISNGTQRITCQVTLLAKFDESVYRYQMLLHYKGATFETNYYPLLDQAFYELQAKLQDRGFYVFSCGSCAFFYHPPMGSFQSEVTDQQVMEADGYCLQSKQGVTLSLNSTRVHVVSPYCHHHRDHAFRDEILKQWKDSLSTQASLF
jgi:hypothetical protein